MIVYICKHCNSLQCLQMYTMEVCSTQPNRTAATARHRTQNYTHNYRETYTRETYTRKADDRETGCL